MSPEELDRLIEELDRRIVAYKRSSKPAPKYRTPLDDRIDAYYRQHPEARAAVEKVRSDPRGVKGVTEDILARAANRTMYAEHYVGGTILEVR